MYPSTELPAWDLASGLYLGVGLLAAERRRIATGRGGEVRVALEDVALAAAGSLGYIADAFLNHEAVREPDGNFVYGTFGTDFSSKDDERFISVALTTRHWGDLCRMTGIADTVAALSGALDVDFSDEGTTISIATSRSSSASPDDFPPAHQRKGRTRHG